MRLPYFPLHVVLFPHLPLPLHIFEERYRAMAGDLVSDDSPFAGQFVVSMICEVRSAEQLPDGRWVILAVGIRRARLGAIDRGGPYAIVEAEPLDDVGGDGARDLLPTVQEALDGYLATVKRFVTHAASVGHDSQEITNVAASLDEVLKPIHLPDDPVAASYAVGGVLQVELLRKQQLLELPDAAARLRAELVLLRRESQLLADGALPPVSTADLDYNPN
jgi:uncharacterized protein